MKILNKKKLEMRKAYFLKAFDRMEEEMAIISFGGCNFHCPYCKRDCQYIDSGGNVIKSRKAEMSEIREMIDEEIARGRRIRLSGGDPCAFPKETLEIARYVYEKHGQKISIAHNGSSIKLVESLAPYLEYIAMDYKAFYKENMQKITGLKNPAMKQSEILDLCRENNIIADVRTPVFADTSYEELSNIAKILSGYDSVFWTLRKYNEVKGCDFAVPAMEYVEGIARALKENYPQLRIGSRNYWKGGFEIY